MKTLHLSSALIERSSFCSWRNAWILRPASTISKIKQYQQGNTYIIGPSTLITVCINHAAFDGLLGWDFFFFCTQSDTHLVLFLRYCFKTQRNSFITLKQLDYPELSRKRTEFTIPLCIFYLIVQRVRSWQRLKMTPGSFCIQALVWLPEAPAQRERFWWRDPSPFPCVCLPFSVFVISLMHLKSRSHFPAICLKT